MARFIGKIALLVLIRPPTFARAQPPGLADEARRRIGKDPTAFLWAASTAIAGFGDSRGLEATGVEDYIAAERAERPADVLQMLLAADLSADGSVSAAKVARVAPSLSPHARGKLIARQGLADDNDDGTVSAAEFSVYARTEALRLMPEARADDLRLLMLYDQNGDGWVRVDEVRAALEDIVA